MLAMSGWRARSWRAPPEGPRYVEVSLLDEEPDLFDFFGLGDLPTPRGDAQGEFFGRERSGGNYSPRQGQRVSRLPREWLRKAGGNYQDDSQRPHGAILE
jgi:hypothetical protein